MWQLWKNIGCILTVAVPTAITTSIHDKDIIDTVVGTTMVIRTWPSSATTLSVIFAKGNKTLMTRTTGVSPNLMVDNITGHWKMKRNDTTNEISLLICNISRHDEGLYHIDESIYDWPTDPFEKIMGKWSFQLNVHDPDEIKTRSAGENVIIKEFQWSDTFYPQLYYYDQLVATLNCSDCNVMNTTHLYGRLNCTEINNTNTCRIEVQNVTQRDTGLYKMVYRENNDTMQCFINITEAPIHAIVGDNVTIAWYYNQQWMNRTLRIIHPNDGVMMILRLPNNSTARSTFQNRASYNGDMSKSYMSFTLCNLSKSDAGIYMIETQYGNNIPSWKRLMVEEDRLNMVTGINGRERMQENPEITTNLREDTGKLEPTQTVEMAVIRNDSITTRTQNMYTLFNVSTVIPVNSSYAQASALHPVPIYVLPVLSAVGATILLLVIGCLLWNQRKRVICKEAALPLTSASAETACNNKYSLTQPKLDSPNQKRVTYYNESIEIPDEIKSVGHAEDTDYDITYSCPSVSTLTSAKGEVEHTYNCIADGYAQRLALYGKVNKESKASSAAIVCEQEYELVDVSQNLRLTKTFNADDIAPESASTRTRLNIGVRGEGISMKYEESTQQQLFIGADKTDYADVDL